MISTALADKLQNPAYVMLRGINILILLVIICSLPLPAIAGSHADSSSQREKVADIIWQKELAIYKARESGDLGVYIANASEHYMGWPPGWPKPSNLDKLRAGAKGMKGMDKERLTMTYDDLTLSADGKTAIIYYSTHRTSDPTGKVVDQYFQICHVWVLEGDQWKLMGAMGRTRPEPISQ